MEADGNNCCEERERGGESFMGRGGGLDWMETPPSSVALTQLDNG